VLAEDLPRLLDGTAGTHPAPAEVD
jgi:hypothetical protein